MRGPVATYGLTLGAVGLALVARWALDPGLGDHLPFVTFFVAVAVAAWLGGLWPALLATGLGFVLAWYFFVPTRFSFALTETQHAIGLGMYLMVSLAFAGFGEALSITKRRADMRRELLRTTLACIGDAVITTDNLARITYINAVAETLTGWTLKDAVGQTLESVFHIVNEETRQTVENPAKRALSDGVIVGLANHTVLIRKDGTQCPIDDSAAPIQDEHGQVIGCVLIFRDIADRRRADRVIADARAYAEDIVDTVREPLLVLDADLRVKTASRSFCQTFHVPPEETVNRLIYDLGNRQWDIPALRKLLGEVLPQNTAFNDYEVEHSFPDIGHRIMLLNARRIYREGNHTALILLAIEDITQRRQGENERRESERRFRTIIEQVKDYAIFLTDPRGRATSWNEGVKRVLGFDEADFIGKDIATAIFTPEDVEKDVPRQELEQAATTGTASNDRWMMKKDGTRFFAMGVTSRLTDEAGKLLGFTKIMRDQTDRKDMEDQLRQYTADLSESDRHKSEFLAMLAHELRNPLAPIRNSLQIMRLSGDGKAIQPASEMMERQVGQMVRLIDDLLDVSRISRGKMELRKERIELAPVVHHAVEAARPPCESLEHELTVSLPSQPIYLNADPTRLAQIIGNLLNNACKFTDRGGRIGLNVERENGHAVIRVTDNGMGIADEQLPRIFDMFMQVDKSLERPQSGLGLGLTLVKNLVEMHDGTIKVHSRGVGQGSSFVVHLPIAAETANLTPPESAASPGAPRTPAAYRILVVDDNRDSATSLAMLLKLAGHETHTAHDGLEAVEAAATFKPEVILLDIGLPKLNGYEACRRIREQPWGKRTVLVALTGWGQEEDRKKSGDAGFDGHLVKPVEYDALMALLAEKQAAKA